MSATRHRDFPAPGYADNGRREPTANYTVVLATSAGRKEVAFRSLTSVSRSDMQQYSRWTAASGTCIARGTG